MSFAKVAVPVPLGQAFSYSIPDELSAELVPGSRVLVELGRRRVLGVVLAVVEGEPDVEAAKLKSVLAVVDREPVLSEELLSFLIELGRYYLAPLGEVMRLALPQVERSAKHRLEQQGLAGIEALESVGRLVRFAVPVEPPPGGAPPRGQAQEILDQLRSAGACEVSSLAKRWSSARGSVKRLEALGFVRLESRSQSIDPFFAEPVEKDVAPELTDAQRAALDAILAAVDGRQPAAFLLDGVTGSGKTEVYLRAVGHAVRSGSGAIILVPEIALTPQLVARFRARLGDAIAVLHSGLTDLERHAMWRSLRDGQVQIAIGARSALFAPVARLGLICVDEEHDGSFKQEEGVRYNARDMALLRAHRASAVCVLGSATPSLGSEALVREQRLGRLVLPGRARQSAELPKVELVDLRRIGPGPGGHKLISLPLYRAIEATLAAGQQTILFLNRRGFAPTVLCEACGATMQCPNCAVALTLHRRGRPTLRCHYCDYACALPEVCPSCSAQKLSEEGAGTERIEGTLAELFPTARVARLDRDVAGGQKSARILDRMRSHEIDVLVGTQMVTKGHDLPQVTLVGVLNADAALSLPDFRAAERVFQLLVQVAGRAGRGDSPGQVLIQTYQPEHAAIALAAHHDVRSFVDRELAARRELNYPPFARIALVRVEAVDERIAEAAAERLADVARRAVTKGAEVVGPAAAPLARLRGRFRYRFMVRSKERGPLRTALLAVLRSPPDRRVRLTVDVDPMSML